MPALLPTRSSTTTGATRASRTRAHRAAVLPALVAALALAACGSPFSDSAVADGERLVTNELYAVVVPESAEQTGDDDDQIAVTWPVSGGQIRASIEQVDATVMGESGDLTRTPITVAGVTTERLDADLRRVTAAEPGDRIRYRVAVHRLPLPSATRPTEIELQLTAAASIGEPEVADFRQQAQRFLDRVQIRGR